MKNWKSHLSSEFEFLPGVNAMVGIMGSGKTSVLQAISFALYGTIPAIQSRRVNLDDMIMKRPQRKERAEVTVEFIANRSVYSVKRELRLGKGTSHAEIRENGRLLEVSPKGVTSEVERILEMDYDLFTKAVYSEQNAIDFFLRVPRGQRTELIDRMLRLDRFDAVRSESVSLSNRIAGNIRDRVRILDGMKREDTQKEIEELSGEIEKLSREGGRMKEELSRLSSMAESIRSGLSGLEEREDELNSRKRELEGVKEGLKSIEERIEKREARKPADISKSLKEKEKEISFLEKGIGEERKSLDGVRERIASLNTEIRIIREGIEELKRIDARCPLCESEISPERKRKLEERRRDRESGLREEVGRLAEGVSDSRRVIEEHERRLREAIGEIEELRGLEREIKELGELKKRRESYMKRQEALSREIKDMGKEVDRKLIAEKRERYQEVLSSVSATRARMESMDERIADRKRIMKELGKRLKSMDDYEMGIEKDRSITDSLGRFVKALEMTRDQLREEFLKTVNNAMSVIWEQLYPYGDFTDIRLAIEGDYVLQLRDSTGWVSVEGIASGGERSIAALALRVAFSMAFIPKLRWLILDEPTHNLDSNAIDHLSEVLKERIGSFAEQVFLITHEDRLSDGISGALYRLERDKSKNGPTRIERPG